MSQRKNKARKPTGATTAQIIQFPIPPNSPAAQRAIRYARKKARIEELDREFERTGGVLGRGGDCENDDLASVELVSSLIH